MTLDDALEAFRAGLKDRATEWAHRWSSDETEDYGFRVSEGKGKIILMHLPDGRTVRVGITVTAVEVTE